MPLPETVEIIDRLSRVEANQEHLTSQMATVVQKIEFFTELYNRGVGAKYAGYVIAGGIAFVLTNAKTIGMAVLTFFTRLG